VSNLECSVHGLSITKMLINSGVKTEDPRLFFRAKLQKMLIFDVDIALMHLT